MKKSATIGAIVVVLLCGATAAAVGVAWQPSITAIDPPQPQSFDPGLVKQGRILAAIGNCSNCHTVGNGKDFAGGSPVPTPFGTIYSSNITPDPDTGIGRWTEAAFLRAMRGGVDREGRHLYPTFPYDHFTHVNDQDNRAIYAYLMTRAPVHAPTPPNQLPFPLDQRFVVAGWKWLFLREAGFRSDPARSAEWNRGAYLVEGLAHCGSCHTPRNALGAERAGAGFGGGDVDNWKAYALNAQSPSPVPWDAEALYAYLRDGTHPDHGTARGPMAEVVRNLAVVPAGDVRAIADYMADVAGSPSPDRVRQGKAAVAQAGAGAAPAPTGSEGATIYAAACAGCHESGRPPPFGGVSLARSTTVSGPDPRNLAHIVLAGVQPIEGELSPIMPGFAASMDDGQITALIAFLRARFSSQPPWADVRTVIADARRAERSSLETSADPRHVQAASSQRDTP